MEKIYVSGLRAALALIPLLPSAHAQCALEKMLASDGADNDYFGNAVALQGDLAFVGAPFRDNGNSADAGAVYVFRRFGFEWQEMAMLLPSESNADQNFGFSLDLQATRLLISAPGEDEGGLRVGAVYVFELELGVWLETAKLVASDPLESSGFARCVGLDGDTAVVGAWGAVGAAAATGAAYVYEIAGGSWSQTAKLFDPSATEHDNFGYSVDVSGDTIFAGAPFNDVAASDCGVVFVCDRTAGVWSISTVLESSEAQQLKFFGSALALDGDQAIVSATGTDDQLSKVYFWTRSGGTWSEVYKDRPVTKDNGEWFGYSVALRGDRALVGARMDEGMGSAYLYARDASGWSSAGAFFDPQGGTDGLFGQSVALDGSYILIGGPKAFPSSGSATAFHLDTGSAVTYCAVNPNSTGFPASIGFGGSLSIAANSAYLSAGNCPAHQFGVFFYGGQPSQVVFGHGFLCVTSGSSGLFRLNPPLSIDAGGDVRRDLDFTEPPLGAGAGMVQAGEHWYFQFWYRDPMAGGSGFNLSNGLELVLCP